jgi:hypothetical protein
VTNNLGRSLTFTTSLYTSGLSTTFNNGNGYDDNQANFGMGSVPVGYHIDSVTDETGRSVSFGRDCTTLVCNTITATNPLNQMVHYNYAPTTASPNPSRIVRPSYRMRSWNAASAPTIAQETIVYDELFRVDKVTNANSAVTTYLPGGILGSEIYRPGRVRDSFGETVDVHDGGGNVVQHVNQLGLASRMVFDNWNRNLRTISPEGNEERHSYDIRSNLTEKRIVAKPAAGSPDLVATTVYLGTPLTLPFQCADAKLCNKPSYEVDPMLARTDYSWSSTHGELLGVTMPADLHGAHPVSTYGYSSFTGTDGGSFYLITSKVDQIDATHTATQTYGYDVGNKFVLKESTVTADSATLRTCYKFNAAGNLISKTDPSGTSGSCP